MELNQIKYFILTAQLQNMSKAARALNIAQPTLSKSIAALEKELETQLFDRSGKKLILNERGKRFLESAQSSIGELESAAAAARDRIADFTLNIGLFCASERLIGCLAKFASKNPGLLLNIRQLHGNLEHINTNDYDVLLYPLDSPFRSYRGQQAYTERYMLAVHKDSPLAAYTEIHVRELGETNLIFVKYDAKRYDSAYHLYQNTAPEKKSYSFCGGYETQRLMISFNHGIGFVPEESAGAYKNDRSIVLIPIADEGFERDVFIGFKREKHLSDHGRMALSFITEYFNLNEESR